MANVVLIYIYHDVDQFLISFGNLYIGTYLQEHGYSVKLFNFIIGKDKKLSDKDLSELKEELKDCICVGFSVMTKQVPKSLELSKLIKELKPEVPIVWGGTHPFLFPEQTVSNELVDFVVIGEGEYPMLELVNTLKNKKDDFKNIKGLVFKKDKKIIINPRQGFFNDLDTLIPDWSLVEDFVKKNISYFIFGGNYRYVEVHTGRGCPYDCTYCINTVLYGRHRKQRSVDSIIKEIKILMEKFNPTLIKMRDENFFLDKNFVIEFCDALKRENIKIKWSALCRVNYFDKFDDKFLRMLKESGCISLGFGAESGSQNILNKLKKGITPKQTYKAAVKCVKYGIFPQFSFMIGLPGETKEDMLKTLKLVKKIKKISHSIGFTEIQVLRPYPGGEVYQECLDYGLYEPKTLEEWEDKAKAAFGYLDLETLPWIKEKDVVEVIYKYASKGQNTYVLNLKINPLLKVIFYLRSNFYWYWSYWFVVSKNKVLRYVLKKNLELVDGSINSMRKFLIKRLKFLKDYN